MPDGEPAGSARHSQSLDAHVAVDINDERIALDDDRVDLEAIECDLVAGRVSRSGESFAQQLGRVDLHAGGNLAAQKGRKHEVDFLAVRDAVEMRIAKADGFTFSVGREG